MDGLKRFRNCLIVFTLASLPFSTHQLDIGKKKTFFNSKQQWVSLNGITDNVTNQIM
jgi:hypothetical protein